MIFNVGEATLLGITVCSSCLDLGVEIPSKIREVIQLVRLFFFEVYLCSRPDVVSSPQILRRTACCSYSRLNIANYPLHSRLANFLTVPPCAINIRIQTTQNNGSRSYLLCILQPATSHCPVFCISQSLSSLQLSLRMSGHCIEIF